METIWRVISGKGERGGKVQRISSIDDRWKIDRGRVRICLLYTSDAADEDCLV